MPSVMSNKCHYHCAVDVRSAFSVLTLLVAMVGRQEGHVDCKKLRWFSGSCGDLTVALHVLDFWFAPHHVHRLLKSVDVSQLFK